MLESFKNCSTGELLKTILSFKTTRQILFWTQCTVFISCIFLKTVKAITVHNHLISEMWAMSSILVGSDNNNFSSKIALKKLRPLL